VFPGDSTLEAQLNILEANNLEAWWELFNYVYDEVHCQAMFYHSVLNVPVTVATLLFMVPTALYLSFDFDRRYDALFACILVMSVGRAVFLFVVLRLIVKINEDIHYKPLKDLRRILVSLKYKRGGKLGAEERKQVRLQMTQIEICIEDLITHPRLVGRLLGASVTPTMVAKGVGDVAAALFSDVVRAGFK